MPNRGTCDILYIEEDPDDVLLFQRAFQKSDMPCTIQVINDIPAATSYLKGEAPYADRAGRPIPDLIVGDLAIQPQIAIEFVLWLRSQSGLAHIRIICLSSIEDPVKLAAIDDLAITFIRKSVLFEGIMNLVRAALPI